MGTKPKEYRALVGMDFKNGEFDEEGVEQETRVEAGDKIEGMPEDEVTKQLNQGNIEEWKSGDTSNVQRPEQGEFEVTGVLSRHANEGADIVLTDAAIKAEERGDK